MYSINNFTKIYKQMNQVASNVNTMQNQVSFGNGQKNTKVYKADEDIVRYKKSPAKDDPLNPYRLLKRDAQRARQQLEPKKEEILNTLRTAPRDSKEWLAATNDLVKFYQVMVLDVCGKKNTNYNKYEFLDMFQDANGVLIEKIRENPEGKDSENVINFNLSLGEIGSFLKRRLHWFFDKQNRIKEAEEKHTTKHAIDLLHSLRITMNNLEKQDKTGAVSMEQVAAEMGRPLETDPHSNGFSVTDLLQIREGISLDAPGTLNSKSGDEITLQHWLPSLGSKQSDGQIHDKQIATSFEKQMEKLENAEREVLYKKMLSPKLFKKIAKALGVPESEEVFLRPVLKERTFEAVCKTAKLDKKSDLVQGVKLTDKQLNDVNKSLKLLCKDIKADFTLPKKSKILLKQVLDADNIEKIRKAIKLTKNSEVFNTRFVDGETFKKTAEIHGLKSRQAVKIIEKKVLDTLKEGMALDLDIDMDKDIPGQLRF